MKCPNTGLVTPIYVKTHRQTPWPTQEKIFYLLAANGLFLCRNHPFFQSCVPADAGPGELARQEAFFDIQYPKIPRRLLELAVGFFAKIGQFYNAEAITMIGWDNGNKRVYLIVPRQRSSIYQGYYGVYPLGVEYEVPMHLPNDHVIIGDIHSHVGMAAFSSQTDQHDEKNRPGIHIVIGRIHEEPPEFHVEVTVDGMRFKVDQDMILEGYLQRAPISEKYIKQVEIQTLDTIQGPWINNNNDLNIGRPVRNPHNAAGVVQNDDLVTID